MEEKKKRIEIIDGLRGFAITLMVVHHVMYNAAVFFDAPWWVYSNPVINVLQAFFTGLFIIISGVSSRFSRGNVERGSIVIVIAIVITYITVRMDMPIYFGILHLLGLFMIFYGLTRKLWDNISGKIAPFIYILLLAASILARIYLSPTSDNPVLKDILSVLGWYQKGFVNFDKQVILPWIFIFLLGTWIGKYIQEGRFPARFYKIRVPFFAFVGRYGLLIYVLHQPVLLGIMMGIAYFMS